MLSLILIAALNTAAPPADKPPQRDAGTGCSATLQLAADGVQPPQPAPCPKPYLMAGPGAKPVPGGEFDAGMNLYRQPARCGPVGQEVLRRVRTATGGRAGGLFYAVERRVEGCALPTPINYHPDYLLPGAADPAVRRGDAPADKR